MSSESARNRLSEVHELARTTTLYGTPILLAVLSTFLLAFAVASGNQAWVRSLAALMLPIIFGSYLFAFKRNALLFIAQMQPGVGFIVGLAMGSIVLAVLGFLGATAKVPIPELLTSGCFSVLVFSAASKRDDSGIALFYGVICGALAYVTFFGWPLVVASAPVTG